MKSSYDGEIRHREKYNKSSNYYPVIVIPLKKAKIGAKKERKLTIGAKLKIKEKISIP